MKFQGQIKSDEWISVIKISNKIFKGYTPLSTGFMGKGKMLKSSYV